MAEAILVLNAGSSSVKFSVFLARGAELELWLRGTGRGLLTAPRFVVKDAGGKVVSERSWKEGESLGHEEAVSHLIDFLRSNRDEDRLVAVGHRVVHGGARVLGADPGHARGGAERWRSSIPLAPLHQPHNLGPIRHLLKQMPNLLPGGVLRYGLPSHTARAGPGVRTSRGDHRPRRPEVRLPRTVLRVHRQRAARGGSEAAAGRWVVAHLGNGASMCAIQAGRSMASTMGFTAVDGLPMGTPVRVPRSPG
jgi:acetate kinase